MGLIKAGLGALGGTLADQWKEYFYCEAMDKDTMVVKGHKRTSARSSNMKVILLLPADVPVMIQRHGTLTQVSRTAAGDIHSDSHTLIN